MMDKTPDKTPKSPLESPLDGEKTGALHGADRSGLGPEGWAEVPANRIGGHPELETAPSPDENGGLEGPQAETDLETGAVKEA